LEILSLEQLKNTGSQFFFYRTHAGAEIDVIIDRGRERIGFEFKCAVSASPRDWSTLAVGLEDGIIDRGLLVYLGERSYSVAPNIDVLSASEILSGAKSV
jgi:uncharacterized protein